MDVYSKGEAVKLRLLNSYEQLSKVKGISDDKWVYGYYVAGDDMQDYIVKMENGIQIIPISNGTACRASDIIVNKVQLYEGDLIQICKELFILRYGAAEIPDNEWYQTNYVDGFYLQAFPRKTFDLEDNRHIDRLLTTSISEVKIIGSVFDINGDIQKWIK